MNQAGITRRQAGVMAAVLLVIVVLWGSVLFAAGSQARAMRERAAGDAAILAIAFARQMHQQFWSLDQTLRLLIAQWKEDPGHFELDDVRARSLLIGEVGEQVLVLDRHGRVTASTRARMVGSDLHERRFFQVPQTTAGGARFTGSPMLDSALGGAVIPLARRLPDPDGAFVGVMVVTLDTARLAGLLHGIDLGPDGMIGLIGADARFHRLVGPDAGTPDDSIQGTEMLAAAQSIPNGEWLGLSALDGQERIYAFRSVGPQEPQVVVALGTAAVMETFLRWQREAILFAAIITLLVAAVAALAWRRVGAAAPREAAGIAGSESETRSRFVAIVSHEIRTPLNAVLAALAMLADSGLQPAQLRLADRAREAGNALVHLLSDILEMSKMEGGRLSLRPAIFALRPMLEAVMEMFRAEAVEAGIQLLLEMLPGAPERLMTDPGRLRQILMNLLSNAVKYSAPGTVRLTAQTVILAGRPTLRLAVRDQGPHIPQADADRLFQPFVRLENASGSRAIGSGLGLAICQLLAELMGGRIGLTAVGSGNEFWIAVPMDAALPPPPPAAAAPVRRRPPRTRILLVDDVPANQVITATMLRREGHLADVAPSGRAAIAMLQNRPYDVVLMDVFMPGMTGLETARRIRMLPGPNGAIPIIAVTANVSLEDRGACLEAGMNDLLGKPVRSEQLQDAMIRHVWPVEATPVATLAGTTRGATQDGPRLDVGRIADLRNSLPAATFPAMVENCLSDLMARMPELRRALTAGDGPAIVQAAHAMVGVCGGYGLVGMRRRLGVVIEAGRATNPAAAQQASVGLEEELDVTVAEVRALVQLQAA